MGRLVLALMTTTAAWAAAGFDYYLLSLSWSPEYCAGPRGGSDSEQCGPQRRYGFVVHGLWPQFEKGYPENCAAGAPLDESLVTRMLPLMPNRKLVRHEWRKHGTCSGLAPPEYFALVEKAYQGIRIPAKYVRPEDYITVAPGHLERDFLEANSGLAADAIAVVCGGRYLREVRVCLDKDLKGRACGVDVREQCRTDKAVLRPVR